MFSFFPEQEIIITRKDINIHFNNKTPGSIVLVTGSARSVPEIHLVTYQIIAVCERRNQEKSLIIMQASQSNPEHVFGFRPELVHGRPWGILRLQRNHWHLAPVIQYIPNPAPIARISINLIFDNSFNSREYSVPAVILTTTYNHLPEIAGCFAGTNWL